MTTTTFGLRWWEPKEAAKQPGRGGSWGAGSPERWPPGSLTLEGPHPCFPSLGVGQLQPDLQEPPAGVEPLQDGPVEHGGGPAGELGEPLLHVGGAPQGGVVHEEGHAVQAAGGGAAGSLPIPAPHLPTIISAPPPPPPRLHRPTLSGPQVPGCTEQAVGWWATPSRSL